MSDIDWSKSFAQLNEETESRVANGEDPIHAALVGAYRMMQRTIGLEAPGFDLDTLIEDVPSIIAWEFGIAEKRFGAVSLHPMAYVIDSGERRLQPYYQLLFGEHAGPIVLSREAMQKEWQQLGLMLLGTVPKETSELPDVVRRLKRQLLLGQTAADLYRERQMHNPDRAVAYTQRIAIEEKRIHVAEEVLRGLEAQYPGTITAPEGDLSADEREREMRELRQRLAGLDSMSSYLRSQGFSASLPRDETQKT